VADVVDAIGSHRPYRPSRGIDVALEEIESQAGILYDRDVAQTCLSLFRETGSPLRRNRFRRGSIFQPSEQPKGHPWAVKIHQFDRLLGVSRIDGFRDRGSLDNP